MENLKGRSFINLWDFTSSQIEGLIELAQKLKNDNKTGIEHRMFAGKNLVLIFSKPSLRTRVSFEVGATQLGMTTLTLKQDEINLGVRETIADTARVLSQYANCVMIRTFAHSDVEEFAQYASIPVINGLTDNSHPCQVMADLLTTKEHFGHLKGLKFTYVGDGNNMANSLMVGCAHVGMDVTIACPKGYEPMQTYVDAARKIAQTTGSKVEIVNSPEEGAKEANIVYTDVWASMGQEDEAIARKKIFAPYQINAELLQNAADNHIVLHCLPAHLG